MALAGVSREEISAAELYSCFPAAVRSFAYDLRLDRRCPLTVTGAMPFAGGPFNHASLAGVARMAEVLRAEGPGEASGRRVGLVTNLSGIFGKQGCVILSNLPNPGGYRFEDVTEEVAAEDPPIPLDETYSGPATIVGYTVIHARGGVSHGLAICDTPAGKRTVARTESKDLLEAMTREEFCGRTVQVAANGDFWTA
jgi:acetyl-CoA C-acetyltransferase